MLHVRTTKEKDIFEVQSHSNEKVWYKVNIADGSCSCPHYQIRLKYINGKCKHYEDLMNHFQNICEENNDVFTTVEKAIRDRGNRVEWDEISNVYGEETVANMLKLGKLYQPRPGFLGVLE